MTPGGTIPIVKDVVLIGGGHTHAIVLRQFAMRPVPGARLTLINPGPTAPYSGMLPGHIAGHYTRDALDIDLVRLARAAEARLILDAATALDPVAKTITTATGRRVGYDIAAIDIGITSDMPRLPGFADHAIPAKPLGPFADTWRDICAERTAAPIAIAILGGGVAGAELALAAHHRMTTLGRPATITLIDRGSILAAVSPPARRRLMQALAAARITLRPGAAPVEITAGTVHLDDDTTLSADLIIGAAGATAHPWLAETGLETQDGFLLTDPTLRTSDPAIYAAGDCARSRSDPRPKAGVYAVRAAPILTHNLRADLTGAARRAFRPQRDFLKLITLGDKRALAERSGVAIGNAGHLGAAFWRWKDRIDSAFMDRLGTLPTMPPPPVPKSAARGVATALAGPAPCGGCGAKLGAEALDHSLRSLPHPARADITPLPGDDAALLTIGGAQQVLSTDHLRAFALDPVLVARVAAIHALSDIWAMGATPQAALATVILPRLAPALQSRWLDEVMQASAEVFMAEGARIVGGHSTMGTELTIGFTVTGLLDRDPITLAGGRPGDALILTKPLGSGTILAAEMRGQAHGADVAACWQAMQVAQAEPARHLAPHATAMTDVTGFGLAGHLANICDASDTGATLDLAALPLLPGAETLADQGIASTLAPQNRAALAGRLDAPDTARAALLYDPQTAGGLLAAVPTERADALLTDLTAAGVPATRIGHLTDTPGRITAH